MRCLRAATPALGPLKPIYDLTALIAGGYKFSFLGTLDSKRFLESILKVTKLSALLYSSAEAKKVIHLLSARAALSRGKRDKQ